MSGSVAEHVMPTQIDQIIPSIIEHDAVSNHAFGAQRILREMGFVSEIYAGTLGPGVEGRVRPLAHFTPGGGPSRWVMYQCSIGSPAAETFASHPGTKLLDYHNITPSSLVDRWLPPLGAEARLGREQLSALARVVDYAIADSPFNAKELVGLGYRYAEVVPVMVDAGNLHASPDPSTLSRFRGLRGHDWLFVGQVAPHKAQHDVIMAFARYRARFDGDARLHLVGREMGSAYLRALKGFVRAIGLDGCVDIPGSVSTEVLAAYYDIADVFVCLSDHEGFCAPIIEAMSRGLPVVAFGAAAVPDTVDGAGVLLDDKDPELVAAVIDRLLDAPQLIFDIAHRARRQAALFTLDRAEEAFRAAIMRATSLLV